MRRWDIYWADVPYEDEPGKSKTRPVIIAKDSIAYVLTLKVTSQDARENDLSDYPLIYWRESGLSAPSVVRIRKISKLSPDAFGDYIGRVQAADAYNILQIMAEIKKNRD